MKSSLITEYRSHVIVTVDVVDGGRFRSLITEYRSHVIVTVTVHVSVSVDDVVSGRFPLFSYKLFLFF